MKEYVCAVLGIIGSGAAYLLGGWDTSMETLITFMAIDYITGLIVAGVFKNSPKTETGALESNSCFKGLCRKCMVLVLVAISHRIDLALGIDVVRTAVCIGFISSEAISITENAGLMGLPIPQQLTDAIDILKKKSEKDN